MNFSRQLTEVCNKLSRLKAGAVFTNAGDEKIKLAVDLIASKLSEIDFVIWIAPSAFFSTPSYKSQIKFYAGEIIKKICFFSIESVSLSDDNYLKLYNICDKYRTFCVMDDSLTIKNMEASRTKRLIAIHKKFKYRLVLSAVPLTQGLVDLYSQLTFIDSDILQMTETQFANYFLPFYWDSFFKIKRRWSTPENEKNLIKMMRPYILRFNLNDWNGNLRHYNQDFELTPAEEENYRQEKEDFLKDKYNVAFMEVAQKFQQIYTIAKNKVEALFQLVRQIEKRNEKVIIYTKYLDEVVFLRESGGFVKGAFVELTGRSNKLKAIRRFEEDINIMFCTYRVDRLNLSLHACDNIIYFSQTFDYKDKVQSLYNLNQSLRPRQVNVYNFWVKTGLENLIRDNLDRKKFVLSNVCRQMSREAVLSL